MISLVGKQNITNYSLGMLTGDNGYYRACIADKLINYCSEVGKCHNFEIFKTPMVPQTPIQKNSTIVF